MVRLVFTLFVLLGFSSTLSSCGGEGSPNDCPNGNETCSCFVNGTCNAGLACLSGVCVASPGTGGAVGTGGTTGAGGGTASGGDAAGTGGAVDCGDTQNSRLNCGVCGRECDGDCVGGECQPAMQGCLAHNEVANCDEMCAALNETCVAAGCDAGFTFYGFAGTQSCMSASGSPATIESSACATSLPPQSTVYSCCCTDTQ